MTVAELPGWISVEDRLPEKRGRYLCWFGKNTFCVGADIATYLPEWHGFGVLESNTVLQNVTHWMPLPAPPEVRGMDEYERDRLIRGLKYCSESGKLCYRIQDDGHYDCCPYFTDDHCTTSITKDALALIRELENLINAEEDDRK